MIAATMTTRPPIILASSSPYRCSLLQRLGLDFDTVSPDIDESPRSGETPEQLVRRLAAAKAARVSEQAPRALIIASDQVAELDGTVLTKPGDRDSARRQLQRQSGQTVRFLTGLCVLNAAEERSHTDCIPVSVRFRELEAVEIERYLDHEAPWDCAGAFKSEGLGIVLTRAIEGGDASALIGLPLIRLAEMLRREGVPLP